MKEYSRYNYKSSYSIGLIFIFAGLTILILWLYFKTYQSILLFIGLIMTGIIFFGIYIGIKSKIIITERNIISKTPFKSRKIDFKDIKKIGVYVAEGDIIYDLEKEKYHKWTFLGQKFIYLTANPNLKPYFFKKPKDYIDFHYRKEIYEIINTKIKAGS